METTLDAQAYTSFSDVIGIIFNNWTAIKLAVEHGMGGPPLVTQRKLVTMVETIDQMFASGNIDWYDISDFLADAMDTEFSTILEDNSSDEVATHLMQLHQMFRAGDHAGLCAALASLSVLTPIHTTPLSVSLAHSQQAGSSESEEDDVVSPQDDGWTVVKRK